MVIEEKITELEKKIEKLQLHLSMLNSSFSLYEDNPIASLVISYDWSSDDLDRAHDIFEKYSNKIYKGEEFSHYELEADFLSEFGLTYQAVKSIVNAFFRNNQWVDVCVEFVKSFHGKESVEYRQIAAYIRENGL